MRIRLNACLFLVAYLMILNDSYSQSTVIYDSAYFWNYYYKIDDEVELNLHSRAIDVQFQNDKLISHTTQYYHDGNWYNSIKNTYQYNPDMSVISELIQLWSEDEWTNYTKKIREYDTDGNETVSISLEWKNDTWKNNYKYVTEWIQKRKTSAVSFLWNGDSWRNSSKDIYAYTEHGELESSGSFTWNGESWENIDRSFYYYDENFREIKRIDQIWFNEVWNNERQAITSYVSGANILSVYYYGWSNSEWDENSRIVNEYDLSYKNMISIYQRKQGGNWNNDNKGVFTKNEDWWMLCESDEWRDDQWCKYRLFHHYFNSENEEYARVSKFWTYGFDENPGVLSNWDSTVWIASDNVGEEEILRGQELIAYPNPSNGTLRILTDIKPTTLYIYNTAGILVKKMENLSGGIIDIDFGNEPKGMYFINSNSESRSRSVKVLIN